MGSANKRPSIRRRGVILVQGMLLVVVVSAIASFSVDVGIFETAKAELQRSADAAALAGAAVLHAGGTQFDATAEVVSYAQANTIGGEKVKTGAIETTFGAFVNNTFTPGLLPTEGVRVRLLRTNSLGNPIRLYCSQLFGLYSVDVSAASVVKIRPAQPPYNIVGIDHVVFGSLGVLAKVNGRIVSNGDVSIGYPLGLLVNVTNEARSFGGQTKIGSLASVGGSTSKLTDQLVYPSVVLPAANDNGLIASYLNSSGDFNAVVSAVIPAGKYVVRDLNILAGVAIRLDGPVTFYVTRNFNIGAAVNLLGNTSFSASNFRVRVLPGGSVFFLATILAPLNIDLYAPDSNIQILVGLSSFNGRLIGKTLDIALPLMGQFTEDQLLSAADSDLPAIAVAK